MSRSPIKAIWKVDSSGDFDFLEFDALRIVLILEKISTSNGKAISVMVEGQGQETVGSSELFKNL